MDPVCCGVVYEGGFEEGERGAEGRQGETTGWGREEIVKLISPRMAAFHNLGGIIIKSLNTWQLCLPYKPRAQGRWLWDNFFMDACSSPRLG